jgi:hypothetical protein
MSLLSWLRNSKSTRSTKLRSRRLQVEALEDRMVPSTFYAATASDLIADIKTANLQGGANSIVLTAPTTSPYVLTATDNTTDGYTVLPVITAGDNLTILTNNGSANPGYGDVIDAGKHGRLFDVASGASLTLENVTLQNGFAWKKGGAIYNQGTLVLSHVLVQGNIAYVPGTYQVDAAGGGIWSNGSLTVENSSQFLANSARSFLGAQIPTGNAFGGAICIAGGTANIMGSTFGSDVSFEGNLAVGSKAYGGAVYVGGGTVTMSGDTVGSAYVGSPVVANAAVAGPGNAFGGGLCVAGGTVTLTNDTINDNSSGIYIAFYGPHVYLDSYTRYHTQNPPSMAVVTLLAQSSLTANANPIAAGSSLTLTASNLAPATPGTTITQVSFFYFASNGAKHILGTGTQTSTGVWTLTVKANLTPGAYTLWAEAQDSDGLFGSAAELTLTVK